jgi:hypothetical protein
MTALDKYTLTCDYADLGATGAQYIIRYDPNSRTWDLLPDADLQYFIMPGTWKVLAKKFDRLQRKFYFKTFYTNTAGDDRVTEETLVHQ